MANYNLPIIIIIPFELMGDIFWKQGGTIYVLCMAGTSGVVL